MTILNPPYTTTIVSVMWIILEEEGQLKILIMLLVLV